MINISPSTIAETRIGRLVGPHRGALQWRHSRPAPGWRDWSHLRSLEDVWRGWWRPNPLVSGAWAAAHARDRHPAILTATGRRHRRHRGATSAWRCSWNVSCGRHCKNFFAQTDGFEILVTSQPENTHHRGEKHCTADLLFDWFEFDHTSIIVVHSNAKQVDTNKLNRRAAVQLYLPLSRCSMFLTTE